AETMVISFDPSGQAFHMSGSIATSSLIVYGMLLQTCSGTAGEVNVSFNDTADTITFEVCPGDSITAGSIYVNTATSVLANPAGVGSYVIRTNGTMTDSGDTRVAIIDDVVVTASVDTTFTFQIEGLGTVTTTDVNGETLTVGVTTTATSIPFSTLSIGAAKVAGQELQVTTNASNGFTVTVQQDGALRSQTGDTIDNFQDGASTVAPIAWDTPSNTFGSINTYGHIGVTSEDNSFAGATDPFGTQLFSGGFHNPLAVFYHDGPADGSTAHQGLTRVAYKVEIGSFQEAAPDYTMTLTYVATPVF
ncbi:MAG: hypothetical protein Q8Q39_05405, partial [bacterium]|nr:hypothetical protein [bacterium]